MHCHKIYTAGKKLSIYLCHSFSRTSDLNDTLSLKPNGNGVCNNFIHFNSVSCLLMILNLGVEFSS